MDKEDTLRETLTIVRAIHAKLSRMDMDSRENCDRCEWKNSVIKILPRAEIINPPKNRRIGEFGDYCPEDEVVEMGGHLASGEIGRTKAKVRKKKQ